MNAARALRFARRRAGLSQTELARRAGVPPQTVNKIERAESIPRVDTLDRLLAAADATLHVVPRLGGRVDRGPIRQLLQTPTSHRLERAQMKALKELRWRGVRFVLLGDAAARVHGAPVDVSKLEIALGTDHINPRRLENAMRSAEVAELVVVVPRDHRALLEDAEALPWLPPPTMRVMNAWLDAPRGFLASIDDLMRDSLPERRELLSAVQEEVDEATPGHRIYRQRDW